MFSLYLLTVAVIAVAEVSSENGPCYEDLGCFDTSYPWTSFFHPIPAPKAPEEIATRAFFASRLKNKRLFEFAFWPRLDISGLGYKETCRTVIIINGVMERGSNNWMVAMKQNLLYRDDVNVFLIDWSARVKDYNYFQAASNTRVVAAQITKLIKVLQKSKNLMLTNVHLIASGLGAHCAGNVGSNFGGQIGRITGLDPAGPAFQYNPPLVRLDPTDAKFVDVIHTNAVPIAHGTGIGYPEPCGHVDFYVNGGATQPGCGRITAPANVKYGDLAVVGAQAIQTPDYLVCSHLKAISYMNSALYGYQLWGYKIDINELHINDLSHNVYGPVQTSKQCTEDTCTPVGYDTILYPARGIFVLSTTESFPLL